MKYFPNIIAFIFAVVIMAIVAETFGAFFTALTGIACYKFMSWAEAYFSNIEV